ncbi:MAG: transposase [Leptolyngbyaceae cyanobacterium]
MAQSGFPNAVATISRQFSEILQYFKRRITKGVVKASIIANRLKLIKRSGYGFRNLQRF